MENNVKITILKNDDTLVEFLAEVDFDNDTNIYTEIPIDENSEFNDGECFNCDDEAEPFYSTSLGTILEKYKSVAYTKLKTEN
jgi:hypothetical protein